MELATALGIGIGAALAGALGAALGIGGGVILVPYLLAVVGLTLPEARGVSLVTLLATSGAAAASRRLRHFSNVRLALSLQTMASMGAVSGTAVATLMSERALTLVFGLVLLGSAATVWSRLAVRNVLPVDRDPLGPFDGEFYEPESEGRVRYRLRRRPVAAGLSLVAGQVSSVLGIGGGVIVVPALNSWCGIPMRVAAATSSLMIGLTAATAAPIYYARGEIDPVLAAIAALAATLGTVAGRRITIGATARSLKAVLVGTLATVALMMLARGMGAR